MQNRSEPDRTRSAYLVDKTDIIKNFQNGTESRPELLTSASNDAFPLLALFQKCFRLGIEHGFVMIHAEVISLALIKRAQF